jgi:hypothetical protein
MFKLKHEAVAVAELTSLRTVAQGSEMVRCTPGVSIVSGTRRRSGRRARAPRAERCATS